MTATNAKTQAAVDELIKAAHKVRNLVNNPSRIENGFVRLLVWATVLIPAYFFFTNVDPYISMLRGITGDDGAFVRVLGFILLCLVQFIEIRPFLIPVGQPNRIYRRINFHALIAYGVDLAVCYHRWPIFREGVMGMPNMLDVNWSSVGSIVAIVLGFGIWFLVRRVLGRTM